MTFLSSGSSCIQSTLTCEIQFDKPIHLKCTTDKFELRVEGSWGTTFSGGTVFCSYIGEVSMAYNLTASDIS